MKRETSFGAVLFTVSLLLTPSLIPLRVTAGSATGSGLKPSMTSLASLSDRIMMRPVEPNTEGLTMGQGHLLVTSYAGPRRAVQALEQNEARALSLTWYGSGYFGDGALVCGYASPTGGGIIALHRSVPDAGRDVPKGTGRSEPLISPFITPARVFELPEPAEFLATGDFDADGYSDLAAASSTGQALYLMRGRSQGGLGSPKRIELPGRVTAMVAGEINRADALSDLAVAVSGKEGPQLLIYEGPSGALTRNPEVLALPNEVSSMVIGLLDDSYEYDLAVAAGNQLLIIHGRDRKLTMDKENQARVQPALVEREYFPFHIAAVVAGKFIEGYGTDLAVLSEDGRVQFLRREEAMPGRWNWQVVTETAIGGVSRADLSLSMVAAKVSTFKTDDLVIIDRESDQVHIMRGVHGSTTSVKTEGRPLAALPIRLSHFKPGGWAFLTSSHSAPTLALIPADTTITVTTAADNGNDDSPVRGGLRDAIITANNTPGTDPVTITFASDMTIKPVFDLPKITRGNVSINVEDPKDVTIDGMMRLDVGVHVTGGGSTINQIKVTGAGIGIKLEGAGSNTIVGVGVSGTTTGVQILNSDMNSIARQFNFLAFGPPTEITNNGTGVHITGKSMQNQIALSNFSNNEIGVLIDMNASNNVVGGFVPGSSADSGFGLGNTFLQNGVAVSIRQAATGNVVINNFISFSMTAFTVRDQARFNSIGTPTAGNAIVGSMEHGILINGKEAEGQKIQGNSVGILPTKSVDPPPAKEGNGGDGVRLEGAPDTQLGGATKGAGNTISRNQGNGITVTGTTGSTWIMGNVIGPDPTGRTTELNGIPTGNGGEGIRLELNMILDPGFIQIGGKDRGAGNIIGGNGDGMSLIDSNNVLVQGNWIGSNPWFDDIGNSGAAVGVAGRTNNITIGGIDPSARNVLAFNDVGVFSTPGASYQLVFNRFMNNVQDLIGPPTTVTSRMVDPFSLDSKTFFTHSLTGAIPGQVFFFQLYVEYPSSGQADRVPLGGDTARADFGGAVSFTGEFPAPLATGSALRMLVSDGFRTIGFSDPATVEAKDSQPIAPDMELTKTGPITARCGDEITYTITVRNVGNAGSTGVIVTDGLPLECVEEVLEVTASKGSTRVFFGVFADLGTINPGDSATLTIKLRLDNDCDPTIMNKASVHTLGDTNLSNNSDEVITEVECPRITGISVQGKHVTVSGADFEKGDMIRINEQEPKKTKFKNSSTLLVKKGTKLLGECDPADPDGTNLIELRREIDGGLETIEVLRAPRCQPR